MNIEIDSIRRRLLVKYPFFGSIVANTKFIENSFVGAAETDGENIYYNPLFINELDEKAQTFIFAHEVCHIAFDHIFRSEDKDPELWNTATDSVINAFLEKDGFEIVEGGVNIPEAINYDAEQMYEKLLEQKQKEQKQGQNQSGQNSQNGNDSCKKQEQTDQSSQDKNQAKDKQKHEEDSENRDVGHDTHNMWNKAIEKKKQQEQNQSNQQSDTPKYPKREKTEGEKQKEQNIKRLTEMGEKSSFKQNKIERKKQLEELRQALASQSHGAGVGTNREQRKIEDIGIASPLIDWRRLLKEAIKYDEDWSYKNASIEDGVVTPYIEEIPRPETEILLDTSGSVSETLLRNFLRECKNILQTSKVKVGCFDDKFYGFTEIRNENDIDNMEFCGGGGTNFDAAVNAFTRRVENKIIFTDGEASMPYKTMDVIWIVFGGRKINPPGGKVINISEEQLDKLMAHHAQYDGYRGRRI